MSQQHAKPPAQVDRSQHLAALHDAWATPPDIVAAFVSEAANARVLDIRRIVAGEQNEVYDIALQRAPSAIVKISHKGSAGLERESWVLRQCAARGIPAPPVYPLRTIEVAGEQRTALVMDKLPGERLCDLDPVDLDLPRLLGELGEWLAQLHAIPVTGFGYLDGSGVGYRATLDEWLAGSITNAGPVFEEAGRSVGLEAETVRAWVGEIDESFRAAPPRTALMHNDLLANHVLVHDGRLSGVIDFGEVASEPVAVDFARWDFNEGERFPVEWIQAGYGDPSLFAPPNDSSYRALWLSTGLWLMQWYHGTGFLPGVEAARDRLLREPRR